ncbi:lytic polysaccharide monooxygenase [Aulographum hederae CBS 113979]|uniref:Lytic polysaccharide monooxygenase n=1 Tax=Aulographum hederae CBS 113979 TaxID=1176131 RepID=A0A6G1H1F6_9PEZI|nr:lytic polysaccharide monooxygenase [Aulographum hederae CBS 113979]
MKNIIIALAFAATAVQAHMQLAYPAPFNATNNPHRDGPADEFLTYPYGCCGRKTPGVCRDYLHLLGTPEGAPTATWAAGSNQNWSITGIGNHYGGSCQIGFSTDAGKTFRVATSYEGNCPHRTGGIETAGQTFDFTVPADLPAGEAVFAWTWINREEEFNMNCAAVTITNGNEDAPTTPQPDKNQDGGNGISNEPMNMDGCTCTCESASTTTDSATRNMKNCDCTCPVTNDSSKDKRSTVPHTHSHPNRHYPFHGVKIHGFLGPQLINGVSSDKPANSKRDTVKVAYNKRPLMLLADIDNGCSTPRTTAELKYPEPGPDVVEGDGEYPLELPAGSCG